LNAGRHGGIWRYDSSMWPKPGCASCRGVAYRRPGLAAAVFSTCAVESAWLVRRGLRNGSIDPMATRVEVGVSMVGLVVLESATYPEDRTTSLNWILPYSVGTAVGLGISVDPVPEWVAEVATLAGVYIAVTAAGRAQEGSSRRLVTAMGFSAPTRSTTQSAGALPSGISARSSSKNCTPPPKPRHDHVSQPVPIGGSGS